MVSPHVSSSEWLACAVLDTVGIQETNVKGRTELKNRKSFTNGRRIANEKGMKTDISRPDPHSFFSTRRTIEPAWRHWC